MELDAIKGNLIESRLVIHSFFFINQEKASLKAVIVSARKPISLADLKRGKRFSFWKRQLFFRRL